MVRMMMRSTQCKYCGDEVELVGSYYNTFLKCRGCHYEWTSISKAYITNLATGKKWEVTRVRDDEEWECPCGSCVKYREEQRQESRMSTGRKRKIVRKDRTREKTSMNTRGCFYEVAITKSPTVKGEEGGETDVVILEPTAIYTRGGPTAAAVMAGVLMSEEQQAQLLKYKGQRIEVIIHKRFGNGGGFTVEDA